jgi:L-ascorbate metabolism protein UlaG (beta-lactamase superfamily)
LQVDIHFYGANCVRLSDKKASVLIDDNLVSLGLKEVAKPEDILVYTQNGSLKDEDNFEIHGPGEYEISDVSIKGIPARAHIDENGKRATIYSIFMQNFKIAILGHIYPELSDEQLEDLGVIDVVIIPVGGNGYTIDANAAAQLVKKIEPKIVIPTHFADPSINYKVPQAELSIFMKEMGIDDFEPQDSLKIKEANLDDKTTVVVLKSLSK